MSMYASVGRWWGFSDVHITEHPQELHDYYKTAYEKEQNEKARQASLTPAEKAQEFSNALEILGKGKGFSAFQFNLKGEGA